MMTIKDIDWTNLKDFIYGRNSAKRFSTHDIDGLLR